MNAPQSDAVLVACANLHAAACATLDEVRNALDKTTPGSPRYLELVSSLQAAAAAIDEAEALKARLGAASPRSSRSAA